MDPNVAGGWLTAVSLLLIAAVGTWGLARGWTPQQAYALRGRGIEYSAEERRLRAIWGVALALLFAGALAGVVLLNR